ncbi:MAG: hypothetical protein FWH52_06335, partial [Synergistaceae bacterium]|nr:hypothetical protein [Synergistaceae bacterium]
MRNWRFFALTVLALITWSGVAAGAPLEHYEGLTAYGDRVYALVSIADNNPDFTQDYHPSKVVEFNAALVKQRELVLQDGTDAAMNSTSLVLHNGKLYVGSVGGMMPNNEGGDVWEVDPGNWTARKLLSVKDATGNPWGVSGLEIASDGRVFILAGGYDASWNFVARL